MRTKKLSFTRFRHDSRTFKGLYDKIKDIGLDIVTMDSGYTQLVGKARMEMKVGLTFACMNLKKLAGILRRREEKEMSMA